MKIYTVGMRGRDDVPMEGQNIVHASQMLESVISDQHSILETVGQPPEVPNISRSTRRS